MNGAVIFLLVLHITNAQYRECDEIPAFVFDKAVERVAFDLASAATNEKLSDVIASLFDTEDQFADGTPVKLFLCIMRRVVDDGYLKIWKEAAVYDAQSVDDAFVIMDIEQCFEQCAIMQEDMNFMEEEEGESAAEVIEAECLKRNPKEKLLRVLFRLEKEKMISILRRSHIIKVDDYLKYMLRQSQLCLNVTEWCYNVMGKPEASLYYIRNKYQRIVAQVQNLQNLVSTVTEAEFYNFYQLEMTVTP
ncbi:hypothetical protein AB6A40_010243 [Gnathostoma spinigerum]|uniref:Uncharacterized protein n=1 Tax=Gnathostoma spinigerum TaxID=75299 RepID=A0ABD6EU84_9BILA